MNSDIVLYYVTIILYYTVIINIRISLCYHFGEKSRSHPYRLNSHGAAARHYRGRDSLTLLSSSTILNKYFYVNIYTLNSCVCIYIYQYNIVIVMKFVEFRRGRTLLMCEGTFIIYYRTGCLSGANNANIDIHTYPRRIENLLVVKCIFEHTIRYGPTTPKTKIFLRTAKCFRLLAKGFRKCR